MAEVGRGPMANKNYESLAKMNPALQYEEAIHPWHFKGVTAQWHLYDATTSLNHQHPVNFWEEEDNPVGKSSPVKVVLASTMPTRMTRWKGPNNGGP